MEHIKKSIYQQPGLRHGLKPLWSAWVLVGIGAVCYAVLAWTAPSERAGSFLWGGVVVGALSLITVVCYWLFGDSRRPYSRQLHTLLEPTFAYYPSTSLPQLQAALAASDEVALEAVRRVPSGSLVLVRYSDFDERVFYSQLLEGNRPLTDIYVGHPTPIQSNNQ